MKRTPLKRTGWLKRRTALKTMSSKRRRESRIYAKLRKVFLEENPVCQMRVKCDGAPSTEVHHSRGRGIWYLIVKYWKASCRACHAWENENRNAAVELGLRERVRAFTLPELMLLLCLSAFGLLVGFIAGHFILKFW